MFETSEAELGLALAECVEVVADGFQYGVRTIFPTIGLCNFSSLRSRTTLDSLERRGKFDALTCINYAHVVLAENYLGNYYDFYINQSPYDFNKGLVQLQVQI